jgi:hypothetical protein
VKTARFRRQRPRHASSCPDRDHGLADKAEVDVEAISSLERIRFMPGPHLGRDSHGHYRGEAVEILTFVSQTGRRREGSNPRSVVSIS